MLACGLTGGKKTTDCGEGGRVTVGRWVNAERAAEEGEADMAEKVRSLGTPTESVRKIPCTGRVFIDRPEDMELRRS